MRDPAPATFDTFGEPAASPALAAWVDGLPAGTVVFGAVKDDASALLGADAVPRAGQLGMRGDLRGPLPRVPRLRRDQGAPPGWALEALGPRAVEVRVGEPDAASASSWWPSSWAPRRHNGAERGAGCGRRVGRDASRSTVPGHALVLVAFLLVSVYTWPLMADPGYSRRITTIDGSTAG